MSNSFENQWLTDLPKAWVEKRADFLCDPYRITVDPSQFSDDLVAHYSIPQVQETGGPVVEPASDIDSSKLLITSDTLLVSKLNPRKRTICIAKPHDDYPTVASSEFVAIKSDRIDRQYAYYLWCSEKVTDRLSAIVQSVTRSHQRVNPADIKKLPWKWPPLETQRRIAQFLDDKTARIDGLIEKKRALLDRLAEKRQALITRAVTKGLNPDAPMEPSGIDWLGDVPAHWEVLRLKNVAIRIVDAEHKTAPSVDDGKYFLVRTSNVRDGELLRENAKYIDHETYKEWTRRCPPEPNDLLLTREAPAGEVCLVPDDLPVCLGQRMVLIKTDRTKVLPEYLVQSLAGGIMDEFISSLSQGSTVTHFNMSDIGRIPLLLPTLNEQRNIATSLEKSLSQIDTVKTKINQSIERLSEYRGAIVTAAVTGQIGGLQ